jgi:hypothetical protein
MDVIKQFAPRLLHDPDARVIHLYSTNSALRTLIREHFSGAKTLVVEYCGPAPANQPDRIHAVNHDGRLPLPARADLVVTKTNLTSRVEWFAASLGTNVAVLPEAVGYVETLLSRSGVLTLVGGEQAV